MRAVRPAATRRRARARALDPPVPLALARLHLVATVRRRRTDRWMMDQTGREQIASTIWSLFSTSKLNKGTAPANYGGGHIVVGSKHVRVTELKGHAGRDNTPSVALARVFCRPEDDGRLPGPGRPVK